MSGPSANGAFSTTLPTLQLHWDSTSLGALKKCPRYYQLTIGSGRASSGSNIHLTFGILYHGALERYDHARFAGADNEEAIRVSVRWAMEQSWDYVLNRPWQSDMREKDRLTLIRSIVWYLDQYKDDPIKTVKLANGKPALELSYSYQTEFASSSGEPFYACGHLDRIGEFQDSIYINDRKTTSSALDEKYFNQFTPDNQMSGYVTGGQIIYHLPIKGIIIDAVQTLVNISRFSRQFIPRTQSQLDEWLFGFGMWTKMAEYFAQTAHWPMNEKACYGCELRGICSKPPETREQWAKAMLKTQVWDPTKKRGDV